MKHQGIKAQVHDDGTVQIYGFVGDSWDELDAKTLINQISALGKREQLNVHINSGGGYVFEGLAIFNYLNTYEGEVVVHIDGLAASMASVIAMAGDQVIMPENALMMIHNPWDVSIGDAEQLRKDADMLDKTKQSLLSIYVARTGLSETEISDMMDAETWLSAQEAVDMGFADEITQSVEMAASIDLTGFKNVPEELTQRMVAASVREVPKKGSGAVRAAQKPTGVNEPMAKFCPKSGPRLAATLNGRIDELETDERSRSDIIDDMASAAGISAGTVNQILAGDINCPPIDRLQGFASALDMAMSTIQGAAEDDGCDYSEASTNAGDTNVKAETKAAAEEAAKAATKAERKRATDIKAAVKAAKLGDDFAEKLVEDGVTIENAREQIINKLADNDGPEIDGHHSLQMGQDAIDKFKAGATASIMVRSGYASDDDTGNEFRGFTLRELARASLEMHNVNTRGMSALTMVGAAFTHSGGDFDNILADVANKAMLRGHEEADETFQAWTSTGTLTDFKAAKRVDLNAFPSLREVRAGAEYKYATVGDRGETIQLATYGELFSIDRQTIINDDLGAFTRIPQKMGRAAIRTVGDLVYAILTGNPTMSDGVALFHANHGNLETGAAITTASVDSMGAAMAVQKDRDSNATALNIQLAYLIVPRALKAAAMLVRDSDKEVLAAKTATTPNTVRNTFEVVADARLDAASTSNWFGAASPGSTDTIEVSYLDGNQAPTLEQKAGWSVDGTEFKVRIDAGVKALAWEGLAKNPN